MRDSNPASALATSAAASTVAAVLGSGGGTTGSALGKGGGLAGSGGGSTALSGTVGSGSGGGSTALSGTVGSGSGGGTAALGKGGGLAGSGGGSTAFSGTVGSGSGGGTTGSALGKGGGLAGSGGGSTAFSGTVGSGSGGAASAAGVASCGVGETSTRFSLRQGSNRSSRLRVGFASRMTTPAASAAGVTVAAASAAFSAAMRRCISSANAAPPARNSYKGILPAAINPPLSFVYRLIIAKALPYLCDNSVKPAVLGGLDCHNPIKYWKIITIALRIGQLLGQWVMLFHQLLKPFAGYMRIDLGGGDIGMAE